MSEQTIQTCPECKHEGKMPSRRVVICDQCGAQADMVRSPYAQGLVSPSSSVGGTWTGGFHYVDLAPKSKVMRTDFCSWQCARAFEQYHERAHMRGWPVREAAARTAEPRAEGTEGE